MEGRSLRDKINSVAFNLKPNEGRKKRKFKEVKLRLISLGLLDQLEGDISDGTDDYSNDSDDYIPRHHEKSSDSGSSSSHSENENENTMNFSEYIKRANAIKVSDSLTKIFEKILSENMPLSRIELSSII
jgi:hypothetical protein